MDVILYVLWYKDHGILNTMWFTMSQVTMSSCHKSSYVSKIQLLFWINNQLVLLLFPIIRFTIANQQQSVHYSYVHFYES